MSPTTSLPSLLRPSDARRPARDRHAPTRFVPGGSELHFGVLGPLAVWTADADLVRVADRKVRAVLASLLVSRGRTVPADRLIDELWGDALPENPANALQARVSQLRRALDGAVGGARALVRYAAPGYTLELTPGSLDAERFEALLDDARRSADARHRVAVLSDALALWRGPALAEHLDLVMVNDAVRRWDEQRLTAVEDVVEARLELGEHPAVVAELATLVAEHPLRERTRALHMRALYGAGRHAEAVDSYRQLRELLVEQRGLEPSPELAELELAVLRHDPTLRPTPTSGSVHVNEEGHWIDPEVGGGGRGRSNVPAATTELVGRDGDVERVQRAVAAGRLVTLTGPGGVGKTSLAAAATSSLAGRRRDGVWWVDLASIPPAGDPAHPGTEALDEAVASAIGVGGSSRLPAGRIAPVTTAGALAEALGPMDAVIVLDNCEHVIEPAAELVARLLRAAPRLRIVTTSREPLKLAGETVVAIDPLDVPGAPPAAAAVDVDELVRSPAVELFVARAEAAAPGFELDERSAAAVAQICRRLDGLPLALELAAARVRSLGVEVLAARMDDRFAVVGAGRGGDTDRHQTLRAMIDWSWRLLDDVERAVLRRLAVHVGGNTLEAAEVVTADDPGDGAGDGAGPEPARVARPAVLGALAALVDRSLVVASDTPLGRRYRLLESVAAYGLERLHEAGEHPAVSRRHADHYAAVAEEAGARLRGGEQRRWMAVLDAETPNLHAALDTAVRGGDAALALRLVDALAWYWFLRGRIGEARRSFALALGVAGPVDATLRARVASWDAGFATWAGQDAAVMADRRSVGATLGDGLADARVTCFRAYVEVCAGRTDRAAVLVDAAAAAVGGIGDRWGIATVNATRAAIELQRGDLVAAREAASAADAGFRELGDLWGRLQSLDKLVVLASITGDYDEAERLARESLAVAENLGLWTDVSYNLSVLGRVALARDDTARADELHGRAAELARKQANHLAERFARTGLGLSARRSARLDVADQLFGRLLADVRAADEDRSVALVAAELGFVAEQRGDVAAARRYHLEGERAARRVGDRRAVALAAEGLAGVDSIDGHPERAAELLGAAAAARRAAGAPHPDGESGDVTRIAARVTASLGEAGFARWFARGGAASVELVVARAIDHRADDLAGPEADPKAQPPPW